MPRNEIASTGIGEIGGVLARGCLRLGFSVRPVTQALVVVAVRENG